MRYVRWLTWLVWATLALGCAPHYLMAPASPRVRLGSQLVAGVAETDITPPPGLALFGHGPEGRVATGFLTRLRCQAFVLGKDVELAALVTCDLGAPSLELHREVARQLNTRGVPIGAERLLLMATHTHAGPAHFFGAANYAGPFGARLTGYDQDVVDWLAERIAETIGSAYQRRARACAGWGVHSENGVDEREPASPGQPRVKLLGLSRNRSYAAFAANLQPRVDQNVCSELGDQAFGDPFQKAQAQPDAPPATTKPKPAATTPDRRAPSDYAVDRTLSVLRIDDCSDAPVPLGVLAVYGMHPTAIANTNDLYHGDVFGFATRALRELLEAECPPGRTCERPVVGIANGIEGDVSPSWGYQGPREARRLGGVLAHHMLELQRRELTRPRSDFAIRAAYRELVLPCAATEAPTSAFYAALCDDPNSPLCMVSKAPTPPRLCREPLLGTPGAGGAEDGPTRLRVFAQMHEGHRAPKPEENGCHAHKVPLIAPLRRRERACEGALGYRDELSADFPAMVPLSVAQLGRALLVATPAELTTTTGVRLRQRLHAYAERLGAPIDHVVITGLTNAWIQYVTTPQEYAEQHYEGASNLYGPYSEHFLSNHAVCLTNWLFGAPAHDELCRMGQETRIDTIYPVPFAPPQVDRLEDEPAELDDWLEQRDLTVDENGSFEGIHAYRTSWRGVVPAWVRTPRRLRVTVRAKTGEVLDDDHGSSLMVRHDGSLWHALWFPEVPTGSALCGKAAHFEVHDATERRSTTFTIRCTGDGKSAHGTNANGRREVATREVSR